MRSLANWSAALAGLMLMLIGGFMPVAVLTPRLELPLSILDLPNTWQVPALLISALVTGPKSGLMASVAYLTVGLFYLPIFDQGGSVEYLLEPGLGYLISFIPVAWIAGSMAQQRKMNSLIGFTITALVALVMLHIIGSISLVIGSFFGLWSASLPELIFRYSLAPLPGQMLLCPSIALLSRATRRILFLE